VEGGSREHNGKKNVSGGELVNSKYLNPSITLSKTWTKKQKRKFWVKAYWKVGAVGDGTQIS